MADSPLTVRELRRLWKPQKDRLNAEHAQNPTNIRFHRACSWLQRVEEIRSDELALDHVLLSFWTAFNALYGQWDGERQEPISDVECWQHFLDRMLTLDQRNLIQEQLLEHKKLVLTLFDDEYLSRFFWQEPTDKRAKRVRRTRLDAQGWYVEQNWTLVLDRLFERIYLLRCQLVHGASTYSSSYNRVAIRRCSQILEHLLRTFLRVWAEWGADEDWGIMCYPPMKTKLGG